MAGREATYERLQELLADEAMFGLKDAERSELETLLAEHPDVDRDDLGLAAAVIDLYLAPPAPVALPELLAARIERDGVARLAAMPPAGQGAARGRGLAWAAAAGWLAAAAGWLLLLRAAPPIVEPPVVEPTPGPAARRAELAGRAADAAPIPWQATEDPAAAGATGDVVWSDAAQQGYMRFAGLAVNDPRQNQYQLWIFDAERDDAHPVDGGVFDIPSGGGEVVVPINAKLPVAKAVMFAVTLERPGGVVVSGRERITVLAKKG